MVFLACMQGVHCARIALLPTCVLPLCFPCALDASSYSGVQRKIVSFSFSCLGRPGVSRTCWGAFSVLGAQLIETSCVMPCNCSTLARSKIFRSHWHINMFGNKAVHPSVAFRHQRKIHIHIPTRAGQCVHGLMHVLSFVACISETKHTAYVDEH